MSVKKFGRKRPSIHNSTYEDMRMAFDAIRKKLAAPGRLSSGDPPSSRSQRDSIGGRSHPCDLVLSSDEAEDSEGWSSFISVHGSRGIVDEGPGPEAQKDKATQEVGRGGLRTTTACDETLEVEGFLDPEAKRACKMQNITFRRKKGIDGPPAMEEPTGATEGLCIEEELGSRTLKRISFGEMPKNVRKIGEATFSEVFAQGSLVYKIIPLGDGPDETSLSSFLSESAIFRAIASEKGVCKLQDMFLVFGRYPEEYLKAWDEYGREENERPCKYGDEQEYGVIVMEEGGESLENIRFRDISEVDGFVRETVRVLANLEDKYEFEHRDLHWGNILIKEGRINLIDFSLSRLRNRGTVIYSDLNSKQWLFEGDEAVDIQFKVYRDMRELCSGCWSRFVPGSNVLWVRYLVEKAFSKNRFKGRKALISKYMAAIDNSTSARDIERRLRLE